jgi:glycolate oxidase FAD binding subunit
MLIADEPAAEFVAATPQELARFLAENDAGARRCLYVAGGRTALHYGYPAVRPGTTIATTALDRVVDFPARDMTITVEAGLKIEQLAAIAAEQGLRLPVDVSQAHRATLGGVIATNTSGPRRFGLGTIRDYVIGISAVDAGGRMFKAGGRVVKNVAGYDLCKMLIGSLGTLAVVTQVTLKLRPLAETSALIWLPFEQAATAEQMLERLVTTRARPVAIELLESNAAAAVARDAGLGLLVRGGQVCVGVEGTAAEVRWQVQTVLEELRVLAPDEPAVIDGDQAHQLWRALTEFPVASDEPLSFQAAVPPSNVVAFFEQARRTGCALLAHAGNGIVIGHVTDERVSTLESAARVMELLRETSRGQGGQVVVLQCDAGWKGKLPVAGPARSDWQLMRSLKQSLDPKGLLNPGRLFPDL